MPAKPDPLQGLEKRTGADGQLYLRASVRIPGTKKKARGKWTTNVAVARGQRVKLLASQEALGDQAAAPTFPTVSEALDAFLTGAEAGRPWARGGHSYAPKTLRGYRQDAALWVEPTIGEIPVDRLRRSQIQALVDEVAALRSGQRARNVSTVLQTLYRHLLPRHDELNDPTVGLQLPAASEARDVIVTPDEMDAMIAALDEEDRCAFALAGLAGLRAGEMKGILASDVILGQTWHEYPDRVTISAGWDTFEGRKSLKYRREGEGREIPIFAPLRPLIDWQLTSLGPLKDRPDYPLLPGKGAQGCRVGLGLPLDTDGLLTRCRLAWGWEPDGRGRAKWIPGALAPEGFRLHDARHSFASALVAAGFDIKTVSDWLGHRHASTTLDRYVKSLRSRGVNPADVRAWLGV